MAGVQTDTNARLILDAVDNGGQLLERPPQVGTLPGGIFDHRRDALGLLQRPINRLTDQFQAHRFRDLAQMTAGVKIQIAEPEQLTTPQLIEKRLARLG